MFQSFEVTARPEAAAPRVAALRAWMGAQGLDAFVVPRADAHRGEYVAPRDERLAWLTGFTGSAGFAAILSERAALFVDGRYTAQAKVQTDGALFEGVAWPKTGLADWLAGALPEGARIGYDPMLHSAKEVAALEAADGLKPVAGPNGVDAVWTDRPGPPDAPMEAYPAELAGASAAEKRADIAEALRREGVVGFVTNLPEAVAWLLNIRGGDIPRTPVAQAFALIRDDGSVDLFVDPAKAAPVADHLGAEVRIHAPETLLDVLTGIDARIGHDPATCPVALSTALRQPVEMTDPLALPRATKTEAEIAGTREAHLRDGAAVTRFLHWLDTDAGPQTTEIDAVRALEGFRRDTNQLRDISFETIAGAGPHGAIIHYRVNEETDRALGTDTLFLVDSGGQYLDGTTDVTRTVPIGRPPEGAAHAFTRVLQGMIAVSRARFPVGVAGAHLDALARAPLWAEHRDYDHGTGHGVGVYLGVHDGPARISRVSTMPLAAGMILSNEPGYYREGAWGIRIENLVVVGKAIRPEGGDDREMLRFDTLTFVPIDRRLIVTALLGPEERAWIDAYHAAVAERIGPLLDGAARDWMEGMCAPLPSPGNGG